MPTLEKIEAEVKQLSKTEQQALRDWLENMLEDELEFTDEFQAKIKRGSMTFKKAAFAKPRPINERRGDPDRVEGI